MANAMSATTARTATLKRPAIFSVVGRHREKSRKKPQKTLGGKVLLPYIALAG